MNSRPLHKRWLIDERISPEVDVLLGDYPAFFRQILVNRGHSTAEACKQFLECAVPTGTEPANMLGIPEAVDRIRWAIDRNEPIAVYGDYDADGVTATALLVQVLKSLGADSTAYIPNRFDEGYGLNKDALDSLHTDGKKLVITVDCGVRSIPEAKHAREIGIDLIITDHHHAADQLPDAFTIINPKQAGDSYPEKNLAGVGLAYKLSSALLDCYTGAQSNSYPVDAYLDLVALGTVADLAPLTGENRALVKRGIDEIRRPHRQGVMALIGVSGLQPPQINSTHIGFALGPRLNAAGRLESAIAALNLLTTSNVAEAAFLAQQLDIQNRERQQITRQIQAEAEKIVLEEDPDSPLLFAAHPDFNSGVVGLAASRLCDVYYRPAIVAQIGETTTRGSCRSIPEFHITDALDQCADLMEHHGGHAAAAGFTVRNENLTELKSRLREIAEQQLASLDLRPTLYGDLEIPLYELKPDILPYLDKLQPTGISNRPVHFVSRELRPLKAKTVGKENNHLRLTVTDGRITYDAIAFQMGHWINQLPARIDILYQFEINEFNDRISLQLNIRDIRPSGAPD